MMFVETLCNENDRRTQAMCTFAYIATMTLENGRVASPDDRDVASTARTVQPDQRRQILIVASYAAISDIIILDSSTKKR